MVMSESAREAILAAARRTAQAHGYGGLNFRDIGAEVGIKAASIYHHFPSKADLGAAVAKRYWEDAAANLEALAAANRDPKKALRAYPGLFRRSLEAENRMCLSSFMAAEYDDLPEPVKSTWRGLPGCSPRLPFPPASVRRGLARSTLPLPARN
jgi:TetR/AcrR family transcriptional regulator, transcriptional repressor for nem operon